MSSATCTSCDRCCAIIIINAYCDALAVTEWQSAQVSSHEIEEEQEAGALKKLLCCWAEGFCTAKVSCTAADLTEHVATARLLLPGTDERDWQYGCCSGATLADCFADFQ